MTHDQQLAQLRHLYANMMQGGMQQRSMADGLLAPVVRAMESESGERHEDAGWGAITVRLGNDLKGVHWIPEEYPHHENALRSYAVLAIRVALGRLAKRDEFEKKLLGRGSLAYYEEMMRRERGKSF